MSSPLCRATPIFTSPGPEHSWRPAEVLDLEVDDFSILTFDHYSLYWPAVCLPCFIRATGADSAGFNDRLLSYPKRGPVGSSTPQLAHESTRGGNRTAGRSGYHPTTKRRRVCAPVIIQPIDRHRRRLRPIERLGDEHRTARERTPDKTPTSTERGENTYASSERKRDATSRRTAATERTPYPIQDLRESG